MLLKERVVQVYVISTQVYTQTKGDSWMLDATIGLVVAIFLCIFALHTLFKHPEFIRGEFWIVKHDDKDSNDEQA